MSQSRRSGRGYRFYRRCPRPSIYRYEIFVAGSDRVVAWAEEEVKQMAALDFPESKRQLFERITRQEAIDEGIHEARNASWLIGGLYLGEDFEDTGQSEEELIRLSARATERLVKRLELASGQSDNSAQRQLQHRGQRKREAVTA